MEIIPGVLLNGFVNVIISAALVLFLIFVTKRWNKQSIEMKAFFIFWYLILFVFATVAIRYFLVGFGLTSGNPFPINFLIQAMIFSSSPWFIFFAVHRASQNTKIAGISLIISEFVVFLAYYLLLNGGVTVRPITEFSAESGLSPELYIIFSGIIAVILICLAKDTWTRLKDYKKSKNKLDLYNIYFSLIGIIFLLFGGPDNFQMIPDRYFPIFRLGYIAIFLALYIVIIKEEAAREEYLVSDTRNETITSNSMI